MSSQYRICIPTDVLATGSITTGQTFIPDFLFHPGPNEVRFTSKGMMYRGELIEDAGTAHAIILEVLSGGTMPGQGSADGLDKRAGDLAMLVKRLVQALRKAAPAHSLPSQAMDYLQRHSLQGSPLRDDGAMVFFDSPARVNAVDVLQATLDQVWIEAMQTASCLVIKMTGIPPDAQLAGRGVRDRIVVAGERIADALRSLTRGAASKPPSTALHIHPSVWTDPALNLLREARDTIVDFGPRGTQGEIIADIDKLLKRGRQV